MGITVHTEVSIVEMLTSAYSARTEDEKTEEHEIARTPRATGAFNSFLDGGISLVREARRRMWIVRLALRRTYTFMVVSMLMLLFGIGACIEARKDIYPYINIPVVTIVSSYTGLPPQKMEGRIVTVYERALTTTVNDIEHTKSESSEGVSVVHVYFQPSVKVERALSGLCPEGKSWLHTTRQ